MFGPKWDMYITSPSSQGSYIIVEDGDEQLEEPEKGHGCKEIGFSRHNRAIAYMKITTVVVPYRGPGEAQVRQNLSIQGKGGQECHPYLRNCWLLIVAGREKLTLYE